MNHLLAFDWGKEVSLGNGKNLANTYTSAAPLVSSILKNSLIIAGIIFLALLIFGGISFIINAGSGDQKKSGQDQQAITSAVIGFVVIFCAYFIIQIIQKITG
jgi:hypothetical protein